MKLCTANGSITEYKILNRDILLNEGIDLEYANKVRRHQSLSQFSQSNLSEKFDSSLLEDAKETERVRDIIATSI
jgi:hypothetical protein